MQLLLLLVYPLSGYIEPTPRKDTLQYLSFSLVLRATPGRIISFMGVVEDRSLKKAQALYHSGIISLGLNDENDENLKIHVDYVGKLLSILLKENR